MIRWWIRRRPTQTISISHSVADERSHRLHILNMQLALPPTARFTAAASSSSSKIILFDVMDTLIADPFFMGFERDMFGIEGGIRSPCAGLSPHVWAACSDHQLLLCLKVRPGLTTKNTRHS